MSILASISVSHWKEIKNTCFWNISGGIWQWSFLERTLRTLAIRCCAGLIIAPRHEIKRVLERYRIAATRLDAFLTL
jgi:hypothetical protein